MPATLEKLEAFLKAQSSECPTAADYLAKLGSPSTSVAILDKGIVTAMCFSTIGDNTETVFQACSISKPVTAMAIMKLVDQGKLSLDGTLKELISPDLLKIMTHGGAETQRAMVESITIRQLMSHTAGLSQHGFPGYSAVNKTEVPTARQVIEGGYPVNTMPVRLQNPPGSCFSYSGGGITLLQLILEARTGQDFATLMQNIVLGPLEMRRSFYNRLPEGEKNAAKAHFTGYTPCKDAQHELPESAAAGLYTTPTDLLKVVSAVQDSLDGRDGAFLRKETAEEMLTAVKDNMGLSWFVSKEPDYIFSHGGANAPGFRCHLAGFADLKQTASNKIPQQSGVAVMTNSAEGATIAYQVIQYVALIKGWPQVTGKGSFSPLNRPFSLSYEAETGDLWMKWKGNWVEENNSVAKEGKNCWSIEADAANSKAVARYDRSGVIRLLPAATPEAKTATGEWRQFMLEGMAMMLRFEEKEGNRVITLLNCANNNEKLLVKMP